MQFVHAAPASVVAPDAPYRPTPHTPTITHDACAGAGWYCPGKHASHAALLFAALDRPGAQSEHCATPVTALVLPYWPAPHTDPAAHPPDPDDDANRPDAHAKHDSEPGDDAYRPAKHTPHTASVTLVRPADPADPTPHTVPKHTDDPATALY